MGKVLWNLWKVSQQPCGKRLAPMISLWLPYYEEDRGQLKKTIKEQLLKISLAQIDRLLAPRKA